MKALSTRNDEPRAGEPSVRRRARRLRDGRGRGDPASSRSASAALARGARDLRRARGLRPDRRRLPHLRAVDDGDGAIRAMRMAPRRRAASRPSDVDYINAHGTSTPGRRPHRDARRSRPCSASTRDALAFASTKSMTGHLLGAAGGLETAVTALAVLPRPASRRRSTRIDPDPDCDLDCAPNAARERTRARRAEQLVRLRRHERHAAAAQARRTERGAARPMKILVGAQARPRHRDARSASPPDGARSTRAGVKWIVSPYDEYALEEALRLREAGAASEVVVVCAGREAAQASAAPGAGHGRRSRGPRRGRAASSARTR